ncbi:MAG TPA: helix-turn-helix transcriptional regulator [Kofleriaceae bacterium]|nr:helix-turn-helix transcriptional regulator [Kofleriaceae bacterium]
MLIDPRTFRRLVQARAMLDGDLTVGSIARQVGMSPTQLIRRFTAVFGATPHQHRTEARLACARDALAAGARVTDVCFDIGFSSLGSFSALFTRRVGAPPSVYRRSVQVPCDLSPLVPGCLGMLARLPRNFREASAR